jgi:starch-binding outer membrane protein, SusD/RagB family
MRNRIRIGLWLALFSCTLGACSKNFLELNPYDQVPPQQSIVDDNSMATAVNGVYSSLRAVDFFGRSIPVDGDLMADNTYVSEQNSNRYIQEFTYTYVPTNFGDGQNTWSEAYNTILRANDVINANVPSDPTSDQLRGEALTIRALSYFELSKFFAPPYLQDSTGLGVPLVLKYDPHLTPARNTVAEDYAQIESDLLQAYGLMTMSKNSSYVTKYVAQSLLARLYLFKGDWADAQAAALDVVNNGGYSLTPAQFLQNYWSNPFPVTNGIETVFEVEFDAIDNNGTDNLDAIFDQNGYGDILCTDDLYGTYSPTDARLGLIISGTRGGLGALIINKYSNLSNPNGKDNTKVIRYAEVLLTLAEAYNRQSNDISAQTYVNQVAQVRDTAFAGYSDTGPQLLNDIILERRKELAFEGHRYWDLVRLNLPVVRNNSTNNYALVPPADLMLSPTDPRRIFPIPQAEINANKNMVQNPGY